MKLQTILEASSLSADEIKAMLSNIKGDMDREEEETNAKFSNWRDSLTRVQRTKLRHIVNKRGSGKPPKVDRETIELFKTLGIVTPRNTLNAEVPKFLTWLSDNPASDDTFANKRADADKALRTGDVKRRSSTDFKYSDPKAVKAEKKFNSFSDGEKAALTRIIDNNTNKRTKQRRTVWNMTKREQEFMRNHELIDQNNELTEFGEFMVNYFQLFLNDPHGTKRVKKAERVGNFGDAAKRKAKRAADFAKKYTDKQERDRARKDST